MTHQRTLLLAGAAVLMLTACDRGAERGAETASIYSDEQSGAAGARGGPGLEGTPAGTTPEAPPQIAALERHLELIEHPDSATRENLTAYRNLLSDVVSAMQADLARLDLPPDTMGFRELSRQAVEDLGGSGGGLVNDRMPAEALRAHSARIRRLLAVYDRLTPGTTGGAAGGARP